eukprot:6476653-Pyramimonas_sp.AAC.1
MSCVAICYLSEDDLYNEYLIFSEAVHAIISRSCKVRCCSVVLCYAMVTRNLDLASVLCFAFITSHCRVGIAVPY